MSKKLSIIGLAGTNGSGKDSIGQILSQYHNYLFISVTDILRSELEKRNQEVTRENLRGLSSEWRTKNGLGVLIDMALATYNLSNQQYNGLVISSLRNPGEADRVHELGGVVLWVDADSRIRYSRVMKNATLRDRPGEDNKTYSQFLDEEEAEMHNQNNEDDTLLRSAEVKKKSDIQIDNSQQDLDSLRKIIEKALSI